MSTDWSRVLELWTTTRGDVVHVYASSWSNDDTPQEFRYRVVAKNGEIGDIGSEAYTRRGAAREAALRHHPRIEGVTSRRRLRDRLLQRR